jgi:uncharacterized membrane protein YfcA
MFELLTILVVVGAFLLAGAVKGVIGLGLPAVSLGTLTVAFDLPTAMALTLVPSFVTNLWQSVVGGNARIILGRLWPFLLMSTVTVWIGVLALARLNPTLPTGLLGAVLITYSAVNLGGVRLSIPGKHEAWAGPLIGSTNGVLTGMTGSSVVPGVMFLQAIGLPRDVLIQAMGMLFTASTVALATALQRSNLLNLEQAIVSAGAVVPAIVGMAGGRALRMRLSERRFKAVFFIALLLLGAHIVANALRALR